MKTDQMIADMVVRYAAECVNRIGDNDLHHATPDLLAQFVQTANHAINRAETIRREREEKSK